MQTCEREYTVRIWYIYDDDYDYGSPVGCATLKSYR